MIDRGSVLSPAEAREIIAKLERQIARATSGLTWIENSTPRAAFEALVGPSRWHQLPGAAGTWGRVPNEIRQGECAAQARERTRLLDERWVAEAALAEARQMAANYDEAHARYDALASACHRLEARVIGWLLPIVLDPNRPPSAAQIAEYNTAAGELQDLAGELLRLSGFRPEWGALSETRPADRISPSMHRHIIERLPARATRPWSWQQQKAAAVVEATR